VRKLDGMPMGLKINVQRVLGDVDAVHHHGTYVEDQLVLSAHEVQIHDRQAALASARRSTASRSGPLPVWNGEALMLTMSRAPVAPAFAAVPSTQMSSQMERAVGTPSIDTTVGPEPGEK